MSGNVNPHLHGCLSLDLEVGVQDRRVHAFAGVRPDTGQSLTFPRARDSLATALPKRDDLADGADFPIGPQPDRLQFAATTSCQPRSAITAAACGGYAQTQSPGLPPQPLSPPGQALPGWSTQTRARQRPGFSFACEFSD